MEIKQHEAVIIHSSIIMIIWNCLIFIVLSGTGREFEFLYGVRRSYMRIGEKQIILSEGRSNFY